MINGVHVVIYSKAAEKDRSFFRDILRLTNVDVGEGWLIFGLPPAEVAVHPSDKNDIHELYFMCDDIGRFIAEMKRRKMSYSPAKDLPWGVLTTLRLPGGGKIGVYQPRHARPKRITARRVTSKRVTGRPVKARASKKS